jgi:histidinol-phosphate phosphatase family protein
LKVDQVVIFVGGKGSRLGKITKKVPKPLIKINNKKFLDILISEFVRFGFKKIILLISYKSKNFINSYHNRIISNTKITCIDEGKAKGTGGALLNSLKQLDDFFLLCNGDTYININFYDFFIKAKKNKIFNIITTKRGSQKRFSHLKTKKNLITNFNSSSGKFINTGYYLVNKKRLLKKKLPKINCSLENDIFTNLTKSGECAFVNYEVNFLDIGIKKDLKIANDFLKKNNCRRAVLLDRDGVINYDYGYVHKFSKFKIKPKVIEFIKFLNDNNFLVFVVTNQSGIGRGYYEENDVTKLHDQFSEKLKKKGAHIDEFFIAPHFKNSKFKKYKKGSSLRKPNIGMFKAIKKKYLIKLNSSLMIGDQMSDKIFAKNCNLKYFDINKFNNILSVRKFVI